MSKKFNIVSFVLIIILIVILIMVMFNYFTRENVISSLNRNSQSGETKINHIISNSNGETVTPLNSGDSENIITIDESGDIMLESGDSENISGDVKTVDNQTNNNPTSVIISSNDEISNKEKKQVLKELDQTLMELLDVVDKVQTVDESRLTNEESEEQKWKRWYFYLY